MKIKRGLLIIMCLVFIPCFSSMSWAQPSSGDARPIVLLVADKIDTQQLFSSKLPHVKKLLTQSACGLMMVRSAAGYSDTGSGYLSLGSGERQSIAPDSNGAYSYDERLPGGSAADYLRWSFGKTKFKTENLLVPDVGLLQGQPLSEPSSEKKAPFGLLGTIFKNNGWYTILLGNLDTDDRLFRPGGFLLANRYGLIDSGNIAATLNQKKSSFPYQLSFDSSQIIKELNSRLSDRKLILVEFGDFFRLDYYHDEILSRHFPKTEQMAWINFDRFLGELEKLRKTQQFSLVLVAPSVSKTAKSAGILLAPLVISAPHYHSGVLTSGTTKWPGLIANNDFLPTLLALGHIKSKSVFSGQVMSSVQTVNVMDWLLKLTARLVRFNLYQRPVLNWYMGLIAAGWSGGLICLFTRRKQLGTYFLTLVLVIPLVIILIPLFWEQLWQLPFFLLCVVVTGTLFSRILDFRKRILIIAGITWAILIIDQALGWHLIRFSALGYNAMSGARYYGMGNEYMGVFLAAALIFAHLIFETTGHKWPIWLVLVSSIVVLCVPRFGAKFGGILAGTIGFLYYSIHLYQWKMNNKKLWMGVAGFCLALVSVGVWDSLRPPEVQTHIGRFVRLFWNCDFGQVFAIIARKIGMNFRLTFHSPWMRINGLALVIALCNRYFVSRQVKNREREQLLSQALLVTGGAAYVVNDAGVLALATCLAFGYSYILLQRFEMEI